VKSTAGPCRKIIRAGCRRPSEWLEVSFGVAEARTAASHGCGFSRHRGCSRVVLVGADWMVGNMPSYFFVLILLTGTSFVRRNINFIPFSFICSEIHRFEYLPKSLPVSDLDAAKVKKSNANIWSIFEIIVAFISSFIRCCCAS
jgi:hypothetical protein